MSNAEPFRGEGKKGPAPVTLHIYDVSGHGAITNLNKFCRAMGTGAFHAAVEIYGEEWSFGYTDGGGSGVFSCPPKGCEAHAYRESLLMGETAMSEREVMALLDKLALEWRGEDYDLLRRNCCSFSDEFCVQLGVGNIPPWVKNLAGAGATLDDGFTTVRTKAHAAAIVAAAKAGEIDQQYEMSGKVQAKAKDILQKAGELDDRFKVRETAEGAVTKAVENLSLLDQKYKVSGTTADVAMKAQQALMGVTAAGEQAVMDVAAAGKESRGSSANDGYKFGDFSRGLLSKLGAGKGS